MNNPKPNYQSLKNIHKKAIERISLFKLSFTNQYGTNLYVATPPSDKILLDKHHWNYKLVGHFCESEAKELFPKINKSPKKLFKCSKFYCKRKPAYFNEENPIKDQLCNTCFQELANKNGFAFTRKWSLFF